ncbi:hypothetical protein FF1_012918 [Malus domestica]
MQKRKKITSFAATLLGLKAEELCPFSSRSNACENSLLEANHNANYGFFFWKQANSPNSIPIRINPKSQLDQIATPFALNSGLSDTTPDEEEDEGALVGKVVRTRAMFCLSSGLSKMGPTSSPLSSTATLLSNRSFPASTSLAPAILTTAFPDLQLNDDFFFNDDDDAHSFFGPNRITSILIFSSFSYSNAKLGFNGTYKTRVSEIVHSSFMVKAEKFPISDDRARGRDGDGESNEGEEKGGDEEMGDRAIDLQFLINGLELGRRDVATLFFLLQLPLFSFFSFET